MRHLFGIILIIALASSCTINKNVMFKTDGEFAFDVPNDSAPDYRLAANDRIIFRLYTSKGEVLLTPTIQPEERILSARQNETFYTVELDGTVKLPLIGHTGLSGMTLAEAELFLEEQYSPVYRDCFAQIVLLNNRIIVFPGSGGDAAVIPLENRNTTVIEALASAGGITTRGDASRVKLIRRIPGKTDPEVYLLDLSTIEGIRLAQMSVQAYDVIYVEPVPEIANELLKDLSPVVSLVTSFTVLIVFFLRS